MPLFPGVLKRPFRPLIWQATLLGILAPAAYASTTPTDAAPAAHAAHTAHTAQATVPTSTASEPLPAATALPHSHSHVSSGLNLVGFLTAAYSRDGSGTAQYLGGKEGHLEGALLVTYGQGPFRFLSEAVLTTKEQEIERLQVGIEARPGTMVWLGRVHQPSSYWNTEFHHGQYLQNSITRPAIEAWEDDGGILTQHVAGLLFETEHSLHNGSTVRLATSAGLAPAIEHGTLQPFSVTGSPNGLRRAAFALRLDFLPDGIGEQAFGLMSGFSGLKARNAGLTDLDHIDQTTFGVYGDVHVGETRWLASVYRIRNRFDYGQRLVSEHATSWFLHGEWRLNEQWMTYARHESTLGTRGSAYFQLYPGFISERSIIGARRELGTHQALSVEAGGARANEHRFTELRLQWSALFH